MAFVSVGEQHDDIELRNGSVLQSKGFLSKKEYEELLKKAAIGCFIVISPHPGYVGFEFAYAGLTTISFFICDKEYEAVS